MNKKLAHRLNSDLNRIRREQLNSLMCLASLSMSNNRDRHTKTSPSYDPYNVEALEREARYLGGEYEGVMPRIDHFFEYFTVSNFTPILQASLSPYEEYLGVIDTNTAFHAIRLVLDQPSGQRGYVWHYSISLFDHDAYPSWIGFSSLRCLCLHIALGRVVRGEITREQFIMFCSDVVSSKAFLSLDEDLVHEAMR